MLSGSQARPFPGVLPLFAVSGVILLPGGRLPLVVFEPRYVALVDDALGAGRLFGLVQPRDNGDLFPVGTLARITAFGETGDGRYLITAAGISRFRLGSEEAERCGYRRFAVDYTPYRGDRDEDIGLPPALPERDRLLTLIRAHLGGLGVGADVEALNNLSDVELADRMAMACPFSPEEKQALLEAPDHGTRCRLMIAMIQQELLSDGGGSTIH